MGNVSAIQAGQNAASATNVVELKKKDTEKKTGEASVFQTEQSETTKTAKAPETAEAPKETNALKKSGNWFTRWLKGEDKECTDGNDNGKISLGEKAKFFGKGLLGIVKGAINNPFMTIATMAGATLLTIATGGAAVPFLLGAGAIMGGVQMAYSAGKLANASTDAEAQEACESMGNGFASAALSLIGLKSFAKAKGAYISKTRSKAAKLLKSNKDAEAGALLRADKGNLKIHQNFNKTHPDAKLPKATKAPLRERLHNWLNKGKETTAQQKWQNNKNDNFYQVVKNGTPEQKIYTNNHCIKGGLEEMPTKPSILKRAWLGTKEKFYKAGSKLTGKSAQTPKMSVGDAKVNLKNAQTALDKAQAGMRQAETFGGTRAAQAKLDQAQAGLKQAEQILAAAKKAQHKNVTGYLKTKRANKPSFLERKIDSTKQQRINLAEEAKIKAEANADNIQAFANALPDKPVSTGLDIAKLGVKGQIQQAKYGAKDGLLAGKQKGLKFTQDVVTFTGKTATSVKNGIKQSLDWTGGKLSAGANKTAAKVTEWGTTFSQHVSQIPTTPTSAVTVPLGLADLSTKPGLAYEELLEVAAK